MKRTLYEPQGRTSLGTVFEPLERRGDEFAIRVMEGYFGLPLERRTALLGSVLEHLHCHDLVLYDSRDGKRVGTFSRESGLKLI